MKHKCNILILVFSISLILILNPLTISSSTNNASEQGELKVIWDEQLGTTKTETLQRQPGLKVNPEIDFNLLKIRNPGLGKLADEKLLILFKDTSLFDQSVRMEYIFYEEKLVALNNGFKNKDLIKNLDFYYDTISYLTNIYGKPYVKLPVKIHDTALKEIRNEGNTSNKKSKEFQTIWRKKNENKYIVLKIVIDVSDSGIRLGLYSHDFNKFSNLLEKILYERFRNQHRTVEYNGQKIKKESLSKNITELPWNSTPDKFTDASKYPWLMNTKNLQIFSEEIVLDNLQTTHNLYFLKNTLRESKYTFDSSIYRLDKIYSEYIFMEKKLKEIFGKPAEQRIDNKNNIDLQNKFAVEQALINGDLTFFSKWKLPGSVIVVHDLFNEDVILQHYIAINKEKK